MVGESSLELLTGDVGQLSLSDERFCFSANKLLLKNDDTRAIGFFVFELSDLVGDLLLAYVSRS